MCEETNVGTYVHSTNGGCFSGGIPFVQCELVAPLVVDGSPTIKSSCSVGVNGFTGSGFICICSEELVLVLCGARIRGHCGWPQCLGPAPPSKKFLAKSCPRFPGSCILGQEICKILARSYKCQEIKSRLGYNPRRDLISWHL